MEAVQAAGIEVKPKNAQIDTEELLTDWGEQVRQRRALPTRKQYRLSGTYSPQVFETRFGPWSGVPNRFREFAADKSEWLDVLALLPEEEAPVSPDGSNEAQALPESVHSRATSRHARLDDRPTYGDPIDFRGLRHAPVNENGVVFLFGMVAHELGYLVEAIQIGFPDCEAKRQIGPGKWQRVRIEFEFESRNFVEHGHDPSKCDVIVCWRDNWRNRPPHLELIELERTIRQLGADE